MSASVRSGWIDGHSVGRRQKRAFCLWAVTLKRLQCCFVAHERGFGLRLLSAAVQLRCGPGEAILSRAKDEARAQERGAFLPVARSFGRVKKIIVVHAELKGGRGRRKKRMKVGLECGRD